jgi:hypothetical protein
MAATDSMPDDATGPPTFSPEAQDLLQILGKNHLRDVTNDEWSRYGAGRSISETLCGEYWRWHCPDQMFLQLISGKEGPEVQEDLFQLRTTRYRDADLLLVFLDPCPDADLCFIGWVHDGLLCLNRFHHPRPATSCL